MKEVKLGDICEVLTGFAFKSNLFNKEQKGIPLIRIRDLSTGTSETYYSGKFEEKFLVRKGDFLIGMDGEFKIFEWKSGEALLNQRVCKLILNKELVFPKYIFYIISKELKEIEDKTPFVTVKHISNKQILSINLTLPSIGTQKQIVSILEKAESLKRNRKEADKLTNDYLKSVFYEIFGNLGKNEKKWKIEDFSEYVDFQEGPGIMAYDFVESGIPLIRIANIKGSKVNLNGCGFLSPEKVKTKWNHFRTKDKDILISTSASTGEVSEVTRDSEGSIPYTGIIRLRPKKDELNRIFLKYFIKSDYYNSQVSIYKKGGTIQHYGPTHLKKIKISIPPIEKQQIFASIVDNLEKLKIKQKQSKEEINQLFDSLMKQAFNGELIK